MMRIYNTHAKEKQVAENFDYELRIIRHDPYTSMVAVVRVSRLAAAYLRRTADYKEETTGSLLHDTIQLD
jgi:hypothetical protein